MEKNLYLRPLKSIKRLFCFLAILWVNSLILTARCRKDDHGLCNEHCKKKQSKLNQEWKYTHTIFTAELFFENNFQNRSPLAKRYLSQPLFAHKDWTGRRRGNQRHIYTLLKAHPLSHTQTHVHVRAHTFSLICCFFSCFVLQEHQHVHKLPANHLLCYRLH